MSQGREESRAAIGNSRLDDVPNGENPGGAATAAAQAMRGDGSSSVAVGTGQTGAVRRRWSASLRGWLLPSRWRAQFHRRRRSAACAVLLTVAVGYPVAVVVHALSPLGARPVVDLVLAILCHPLMVRTISALLLALLFHFLARGGGNGAPAVSGPATGSAG